MSFFRRQARRKAGAESSSVAFKVNRGRNRWVALTLEVCEDRALMATILGSAESFAVLGASTVTNTGATAIFGSVGVSPGTAITGFPPGVVTGGTTHSNDAVAVQAHADLVTAYGVIAGQTSPPANDLTGQDLGGRTLTPGVYSFSTAAPMTGALVLDAQGDPNARFDFQIGTTLITASGASVQLINGAQFDNVYYQVGSSATLGTNTAFAGNILADQDITLTTGATIARGRAMTLVGAVTMDTNQISITAADLGLTKSTTAVTVFAGDMLTYAITVTNAGPSDAQAVLLSDLVPAGATFVSASQSTGPAFALSTPAVGGTGSITGTLATLASGASATFTVVVQVDPAAASSSTVVNTATVATSTYDNNPDNNSQTVTTSVLTESNLSLTKTSNAATVLAGAPIVYTITVANVGPSDAQAVLLSDLVPAGATFVSASQTSGPAFALTTPSVGGTGSVTGALTTLASGSTATFTVVVLVSPGASGGSTVVNTASVSTATHDPNPDNNSQSVTTGVLTQANLALTKTTTGATVLAGNTVLYMITVTNAGPSHAQSVALSDLVPAGATFVSASQTSGPVFSLTTPAAGGTGAISGTLATLDSGSSATFTVVVLVSPGASGGSTVVNTASVSTATPDPNPDNNSQSVTTNVLAAPPIQAPSTPPTVVGLQRYGVHAQPTVLVVSFSSPLDPSRASDVNNYQIVLAGGTGRVGLARGQVVRVSEAVYDPTAGTVTLHLFQRLNLHYLYRITVAATAPGGLTDVDGAYLDGAGTGEPGSDYSGLISRSSYAGPLSIPVQSVRAATAWPSRVVHALSASAVDGLAISGRLPVRAARGTMLFRKHFARR